MKVTECDNTYAISTQQLSESLSRAGATAQTFGVDLEHLVGNVTAVGEVTQEAGSKIGNALRTIYSRVTTHKDSIEVLEGLGIALHEMTEQGVQVRQVSDILDDLAGMWDELSAAQQQNIGLAMAGRHRLTQFTALMNNYGVSVEATETALRSQGSAMREQRKYMESYEYQMQVMNATASDLALTIEDKLVGDAMYLVITSATDLMEVMDDVFDTFGVLPILALGASGAFVLLNGNLGDMLKLMRDFATTGVSVPQALGRISGGIGKVIKSIMSLKGLAVVAGITAVAWALEKLISKWAENRRATEEAKLAMQDAMDAYNGHGQDISALIDRYDELHEAQKRGELDAEGEREYLDVVNQISTILPNAVSHIDAQGQAHLKNSDLIRREVSSMEELVAVNEEFVRGQTDEILREQSEAFEGAFDRINSYRQQIWEAEQNLERYSEKLERASELQESDNVVLQGLGKAYEWVTGKVDGVSTAQENLFEAQYNSLSAQYELKNVIQETANALGGQAIALLESDGKLENLSSSAQAVIRDFSSYQAGMLENIDTQEDWDEATQILSNNNIRFGEILSGVYNDIATGMDNINPESAVNAMDTLVASLPEEFFSQSMNQMQSDLKAFGEITTQIMSGADLDVEKLIARLEDAGVESSIARKTIAALGTEFENQSIKAAIAEDELASYNEELVKTRDTAIEAIDPLEQLFGVGNDELNAMQSHIQTLQVLQQVYGDTWAEHGRGQQSITELALAFGQSEEWVRQNTEQIAKALQAASSATVSWSEESQRNVFAFDDSVDEQTQNLALNLLSQIGMFGDFTSAFAVQSGVVIESEEKMEKRTESLKEKFDEFYEDPSENNHSLLLTEIQGHLSDLDGTFVAVKDSAGNLKLQMADGTESEFLNTLNEQLEESGLSLELTHDETGEFYNLLVTGPDGQELVTLASLNNQAEDGDLALQTLTESFNGLKNATTEEQKETYIEVLNNQIDAFGEDLKTVEDEAGNLKLQFADGSSSPWLDTLNQLIEDLGLEIELTKSKTGELQLVLKEEDGTVFFKTSQEEAKNLNEELDDTQEKVDDLSGEKEPVKIGLDDSELQNELNYAEVRLGEVTEDKEVPVDLNKTEFDKGLQFAGDQLGELTGTSHEVPIEVDDSTVERQVGDTKAKIEEGVKPNEIDLKINEKDLNSFNSIVEKLQEAKVEMADVEGRLEKVQNALRVTGESLETIMSNIETLNNANSAVNTLKDSIDLAINQLGILYGMLSDDVIDTSAITNSATVISEESGRIQDSMEDIMGSFNDLNGKLSEMNGSFDVTPLTNWRVETELNTTLAINSFANMATVIPQYMNTFNSSLSFNTSSLVSYRLELEVNLNIIANKFNDLSNSTVSSLVRMSSAMLNAFSQTTVQMVALASALSDLFTAQISDMTSDSLRNMVDSFSIMIALTEQLRTAVIYHADNMNSEFNREIDAMLDTSVQSFRNSFTEIVNLASSLPRRIGGGIRSHMREATDTMQSLADNMVSRFKKALDIHSPSRVFHELGGHVIDGLVNGLTEGNLTDIGQSVFSDFSDGAISTIDQIKSYMTFEPVTSGSFGQGFTQTSGFGPRKSPGGIGSTNHKGVDFAAPIGTPIRAQASGTVVFSGYRGGFGNHVIVESAGGVRHIYGHNSKNSVSVGQTVGSGQVIGLVGSTGNSTGPHVHYEVRVNGRPIDPTKFFRGFANGGFVENEELAWHGEEGPEAIIPLVPERRQRGLDLWEETGERLGIDEELLRLLSATQRHTATVSGATSFAGLDGEAGGAGDGEASATSGVVKPDYSSVMRSLGISEQPMFTPMEGELDPLYRRNMTDVRINRHSAMVTLANTELSALTEQTLEYRNALEEVNLQESRLRNETQKKLNQAVKRQSQIEKELSGLKNTSKHTEEQRKKYNELQQEFDKNTESIYSMENEIRKLNIGMDERKVAIYTDYLGQLTSGYQELRDEITETTQDLEFNLERLTLTDSNDIAGQLKIQYDILKESMRMENTLANNMNALQNEYNRAVSRYGRDSEQALLAREELLSVEDSYQSSVLERIQLEQEIEQTRKDVATEGIDTLKNYYGQVQTMTERSIELERKALEEQHKHKMSLYDEEIAKIESVYDTRLQEMDDERAEEEYQETIADLNAQRADLMSQISRASRDSSLEGKKRLAELQTQLGEVNQEITDAQRDRQDEMYRQAIERQKQQQIEELELSKQQEEEEQEIRLASLDQQLVDAQAYANRMMNDEAMWNDLMNRFVAGDSTPLSKMMNEMQSEMARFMSGDYSGISMGYDYLSDEDKATFAEDSLLEVSNLMVEASDSLERFVSASGSHVQNIGWVHGESYNAGAMTNFSGSTLSTRGKLEPNIPDPPKPAPKPKQDNRYHTIKKGDTLWDLAQRFYGNPYKWTTIAQANQNPDPRRLRIGRKMLIPFRSGGFTGDWVGDEGRVALLHKKELVLNEKQTEDILNVAKLVDKVSDVLPRVSVARPDLATSGTTHNGDTYVIDKLEMSLEGFKGTPADARRAFDNLAKELKKRGK